MARHSLGARPTVRALHIPGHTLGAVAYVAGDAVFTGDTLFLAGCGRLFEGTPAMMFHSLCEVLGPLGENMRVFCGHEYTVSNLAFAASVEPGNARVEDADGARTRASRQRRANRRLAAWPTSLPPTPSCAARVPRFAAA